MTRANTRFELTTARAPYRRAGVVFASNREAVTLTGADLDDGQLRRLAADPAIRVRAFDAKSGEGVVHVLDDGRVIGDPELVAAHAEAQARAEAAAEAAAEKAARKAAADAARAAADKGSA